MPHETPASPSGLEQEPRSFFEMVNEVERNLFSLNVYDTDAAVTTHWRDDGYSDLYHNLVIWDRTFADLVRAGDAVAVNQALEHEMRRLREQRERAAAMNARLNIFSKRCSTVLLGLLVNGIGHTSHNAKPTPEDVQLAEHPPVKDVVEALREEELQALDPEASTERQRDLLGTFPRPIIVGEVASIGFIDGPYPPRADYGKKLHDHWRVIADAGEGEGLSGTRINFREGAKDEPSEALWGEFLGHELGHGIDWRTSRLLTLAERTVLKAEAMALVQWEGRSKFPYVEAIENDDKAIELENKTIEYWAMLTEFYLKCGPLTEKEEALVDGVFKKYAPTFDRRKACTERTKILEPMTYEEVEATFKQQSEVMRDRHVGWLERHEGEAAKHSDPEQQREGRKELVAYLKKLDAADASAALEGGHGLLSRRELAEAYLEYCDTREFVASVKSLPVIVRPSRALRQLWADGERIERMLETANFQGRALLDDMEAIINAHDLVIGRFRKARMTEKEVAELFPEMSDRDRALLSVTGWMPSSSTAVQRFVPAPEARQH